MRYQVIVTVDVNALKAEEAEREAMKAIVSDIAGWSKGVIDVRTEVHSEMLTLEEVVERTGMSSEMIERAIGNGLFPESVEGRWRSSEVEGLMQSLGTSEELAFEEDE